MLKKIVLGSAVCLNTLLATSHPIDLKIRAAYTYFNSRLVREIFSNKAYCTQIEADFSLNKYLTVFLNADYLNKSGHSDDLKDHTTLDMGDLSLGLIVTNQGFKTVLPYIGLGVVSAIVHTHDYSPYVKQITNRYSTGLVAKAGIDFVFAKRWLFDVFCDYSYQPLHVYYKPAIDQEHINMGSIKAGAGLGCRF